MNDPSKRIDVEKSSLLSLKTEVLKKQAEIRKRKEENPETYKIAKKHKIFEKIKGNESKNSEVKAKSFEVEDSSQLARSKMMLEAKAKYYERMSKGDISDNPCSLVLFTKKIQDEQKDDLVEHTDCFGRSRKVSKKELERLKKDDEELTEVVEERLTQEEIHPTNFRTLDARSEDAEKFFQQQKDEWRKTEEINKDREQLFYSNVLFDEARTHGVSYYGFSQDLEERKDQQKKLQKMREATEEAQEKRLKMKSARDTLLATRVEMAKQRLRDKGIVVEDKKEETKSEESSEAVKEIQKDPEVELQREMERRSHIRPWDKGKESTNKYDNFEKPSEDWRPQKERMIMTQDEWVDKQRSARNSEFAPIYDNDEPRASVPRRHPTTNYKNMEESIAAGLKFMKQKFGSNKD